jgi:hypothetical protein
MSLALLPNLPFASKSASHLNKIATQHLGHGNDRQWWVQCRPFFRPTEHVMAQKYDMSYIITLELGYSVRMVRFGVRREFSKNQYGERGALFAALDYRDSLYKEHGIGPRHKDKPNLRIKSRQPNGSLSGVSLSIEGTVAYFVSRTHDGTNWQKVRFSLKDFGYVEAFRAAVRFRLKDSGLNIDPASIPLQLPTIDQYLKLLPIIGNLPAPAVAIP